MRKSLGTEKTHFAYAFNYLHLSYWSDFFLWEQNTHVIWFRRRTRNS